MAFDFMKNFMLYEDDERFAKLCESMEDCIREVDSSKEGPTDLEIMQALDFVGFNLFRDDWEEFKKMESNLEPGLLDPNRAKSSKLIH